LTEVAVHIASTSLLFEALAVRFQEIFFSIYRRRYGRQRDWSCFMRPRYLHRSKRDGFEINCRSGETFYTMNWPNRVISNTLAANVFVTWLNKRTNRVGVSDSFSCLSAGRTLQITGKQESDQLIDCRFHTVYCRYCARRGLIVGRRRREYGR